MGFFSFIVLLAIAYLVWRVTDQLPDLIFRLSEIQRDVAEIRRRLADSATAAGTTGGPREPAANTAENVQTGPAGTSNVHGDESGADYTGH